VRPRLQARWEADALWHLPAPDIGVRPVFHRLEGQQRLHGGLLGAVDRDTRGATEGRPQTGPGPGQRSGEQWSAESVAVPAGVVGAALPMADRAGVLSAVPQQIQPD